MGRAEGVVGALGALGKARQALELAQRRHRLAPAGEDLVTVCLVADVPDDAVIRGVEGVVQRNRQLDRAEVRRQVATGPGDGFDEEGAQLVGEPVQVLRSSRRRSAGSLMVSRSG